jgi:hypothetical protein
MFHIMLASYFRQLKEANANRKQPATPEETADGANAPPMATSPAEAEAVDWTEDLWPAC